MSCRILAAITLSVSMLPLDSAAAVLRCGPYTRPVVRTVVVHGRVVEQVSCVGRSRVYYAPTATHVVHRRVHRVAVHRYHRSWKKTALVIGGATAAGAGIGALAGGKTGAVIGGAAGAAAGTAYEVHKRRKHHRRY